VRPQRRFCSVAAAASATGAGSVTGGMGTAGRVTGGWLVGAGGVIEVVVGAGGSVVDDGGWDGGLCGGTGGTGDGLVAVTEPLAVCSGGHVGHGRGGGG
jgi:hypothetical protein